VTSLNKLEDARHAAAAVQSEVYQKEAVLSQAQRAASALLKDITESTMRAEKKKGEVVHAKNQLAEQQAAVQQDKDESVRGLAAARPPLLQVVCPLFLVVSFCASRDAFPFVCAIENGANRPSSRCYCTHTKGKPVVSFLSCLLQLKPSDVCRHKQLCSQQLRRRCTRSSP
jgi:hypothetical protein